MRTGSSSEQAAAHLIEACEQDILFFFNFALWTYDPRRRDAPLIPFITWEFQDRAILTLSDACGDHDVLIEKSRDMGASWILLGVFFWRWMFYPGQAFLLGSRKEEYVDKRGDPKSLFWKLDFMLSHLPVWMAPTYERTSLHLANLDNGSTIDGESTNKDFARGGRFTAIGLDEFAAVETSYEVDAASQHATDCRFVNSTPRGVTNAFYDIRQRLPQDQIIRLHWTEHPEKRKGLYTSKNSELIILDTEYKFPEGYPFLVDGKVRSPWYDTEQRRTANDVLLAQEVDIDYHGSGFPFFQPDMLDRLLHDTCLPPFLVGEAEIDYDAAEVTGFDENPKGRFRLWMNPDAHNRMPGDRYFAWGADISTGTGASNSVLSMFDMRTKEQVLEFVDSRVRPEDFAVLAVATARWFKGIGREAAGIWEASGPGRNFGDRVMELGFSNLYFREQEQKLGKPTTDVPGWWPTKQNKADLYIEYRRAMNEGGVIIRSRDQIEECRQIVYTKDQQIVHGGSMNAVDPSGARDNHGDRPTAGALGVKLLGRKKGKTKESEVVVPEGSLAWRRKKRALAAKQQAQETW